MSAALVVGLFSVVSLICSLIFHDRGSSVPRYPAISYMLHSTVLAIPLRSLRLGRDQHHRVAPDKQHLGLLLDRLAGLASFQEPLNRCTYPDLVTALFIVVHVYRLLNFAKNKVAMRVVSLSSCQLHARCAKVEGAYVQTSSQLPVAAQLNENNLVQTEAHEIKRLIDRRSGRIAAVVVHCAM